MQLIRREILTMMRSTRNNYTNYGQYNVKDTYMSQIQNYLNEFTLKGYSTEYENFFAALNQRSYTG